MRAAGQRSLVATAPPRLAIANRDKVKKFIHAELRWRYGRANLPFDLPRRW